MLEDDLKTGIILARWHSLTGGVAAHGALIALRAVGTIVRSVFGTRRSSLAFLDRLAKFQSIILTSDTTRWNVTVYYLRDCVADYSLAPRSLRS